MTSNQAIEKTLLDTVSQTCINFVPIGKNAQFRVFLSVTVDDAAFLIRRKCDFFSPCDLGYHAAEGSSSLGWPLIKKQVEKQFKDTVIILLSNLLTYDSYLHIKGSLKVEVNGAIICCVSINYENIIVEVNGSSKTRGDASYEPEVFKCKLVETPTRAVTNETNIEMASGSVVNAGFPILTDMTSDDANSDMERIQQVSESTPGVMSTLIEIRPTGYPISQQVTD